MDAEGGKIVTWTAEKKMEIAIQIKLMTNFPKLPAKYSDTDRNRGRLLKKHFKKILTAEEFQYLYPRTRKRKE